MRFVIDFIVKVLICAGIVFIAFIIMGLFTLAHAGEWKTDDTIVEGMYMVSHAIDMGTTLDIENHPGLYETNPLMGRHPSRDRIYAVMGADFIIHPLISYLLPESWVVAGYDLHPRRNWQAITLGMSMGLVQHNFQAGLKINF
jgi:hypothetical protein